MKVITRIKCRREYPNFPLVNESRGIYRFPEVVSTSVIGLRNHFRLSQFLRSIISLLDALECEELVFLPASKSKWLSFMHRSSEFRRAVAYFKTNGIERDFDGGIIVAKEERKFFFESIYTMTTLSGAFPTVYFIDKSSNILGNICQYNHLHLSTFNGTANRKVKKFLKASDLIETKDAKD